MTNPTPHGQVPEAAPQQADNLTADVVEKMISNTWDHFGDVLPTLKAISRGDWYWGANQRCKYIEIRIDTRDGGCFLFDSKGVRISPEQFAHQSHQMGKMDPWPHRNALDAAPSAKFKVGDLVTKTKGSQWTGRVVGTYSATLTPEGYAVESSTERGSVQIYPAAALELVQEAQAEQSAVTSESGTPPAEQQAAPKAAPTRTALPEGWTDCTIEFGNDGPEVVAYGPKRMMNRLAKWLGKYFAQVIADAAPKAAPVVWLSSKQLRGVTALHGQYLPFRRQPEGRFDTPVYLEQAAHKAAPGEWTEQDALGILNQLSDGPFGQSDVDDALDFMRLVDAARRDKAAPQQEAQEPAAWQGVHDQTDLYYTKPVQADVRPLYAAPQPSTTAQSADSVQEDAARYRFLAGHCRSTSEHWGGRWSIVVDGPAPKSHDSEDDFDEAVDAALAAQGGK